jgi:hypothetical protein
LPIAGTCIGNGQYGAAQNVTVNLSGSVVAPTLYVPAFFTQTANSTIPTFTTSSTQSPGNPTGYRYTYAVATDSTQYNWIATNKALSSISIESDFGNIPLTPDVTGTTTLQGQSLNIYGFTRLGVGTAATVAFS